MTTLELSTGQRAYLWGSAEAEGRVAGLLPLKPSPVQLTTWPNALAAAEWLTPSVLLLHRAGWRSGFTVNGVPPR